MRLTVYFPEDSPTTQEFLSDKISIGRLGDNDVQLDEGSVSSRHAEIDVSGGAAVLRDLESTNGTFLNGEQVSGEVPLSEGDEIYFGGVRAVFMPPVVEAVADLPPAAAPVELAVASEGTGRPASFTYLSPLPRPVQGRDSLGLVAWACAGIGMLAGAYALFAIFTA